jgi:expansin (peptidoglycan-binding protein)
LGGTGPADGTAATGGLGTGGEATGGASLGGAGAGGASAGGAGTGGINTGGSATGGINTGGSATGGINTGGSATGGINTGGSATGGINTGGSATGGQSSGSCDFSSLTSYEGNGSVTFYDPSGQVNCSFPMSGSSVLNVSTGNGEYIVAMGPTDYGNSATCGACVEVTRDDGQSVTVTVADQCPECQAGHIDLSRAAFLQIGTESEGYLGTTNGGAVGIISWRYVPCPVQGNVIITLKEPSNQGWNEFMVQNSRLPIVSFEANWSGSWVTGTRQTYDYFNVGGSLSFPLQVRLTDINGNVIEGTLQANQADQDLGVQFPSCN